jgi:hypothetical protein
LIEELLRQEETRNKLQFRRLRLSQGFTYSRDSKILGTWELAPRYIGLYPVQKKIGAVAYRLELLEGMADIHPVFHVSQLRRCLRVPEKEHVPEEEIYLQTDLRYQEVPIKILDTIIKRTRNSELWICIV